MTSMHVLDPWQMPLSGISLIEASAGTGKTYSITSLYLRLLLERALTVREILVVTFTKAATEELRERIRARLVQAMRFLEAEDQSSCHEQDGKLAEWLYARTSRDADCNHLKAALVSMDEAAVFTIHGFCQRILQENAFDTGMPFELEFIESEELLRQQAIEDFWRHWFSRTDIAKLAQEWLLRQWSSPASLLASVDNRLAWDGLRLLPEIEDAKEILETLEKSLAVLNEVHRAIKNDWREAQGAVQQILQNDPALNRQSYNKKAVATCLEIAGTIGTSDDPVMHLDDKFKLLTPEVMAAKTKKHGSAPENHFFDTCASYQQAVDEVNGLLKKFGVAFMREARVSVQRDLQQSKSRRGQLYFDDLLTQLDAALQGDRGNAMVTQLRNRFPIAMIDEFQDTDAVQYRIFNTIYGSSTVHDQYGLYLIGDPKQAIYSFRGGDIFTYLNAAKDANYKYSLNINWRSSSRLVKAVNTLFTVQDTPFVQQEIDYHPVEPSPHADAECLLLDGEEPAPLMIWKLWVDDEKGKPINIAAARDRAAAHCSHHIAAILEPGRATLGERALQAGDIAILVRSHSQASLVCAVLADHGINSVTLSEESVFQSEEATSLLHLLTSIAECEDEKALRYALADTLLGRTAAEIDALLRDDCAWETTQQYFFDCRRIWREHGFVQAFQFLFSREQIAQRLLNLPAGERRLTNLLQLVELLQQASMTQVGIEELLRWFADEIAHSGSGEAAKLRLESDEALVKVVTMHASKGLEYPVVYIPFPWNPSGGRTNHFPWFYHDEKNQPCLYLGGGDGKLTEAAESRQQQEKMAEDMRLFYVAMTRAAKLCVLSWGKINTAEKSAMAWLLYPGEKGQSRFKTLTEDEIFTRLDDLAAAEPEGAIEVCEPPPEHYHPQDEKHQTRCTPQARSFASRIERNWQISSYSALTRGVDTNRPDYDALPVEEKLVVLDSPLQQLPAGSHFGVFMHQLFEEIDFSQINEAELREKIEHLALRFGLTDIQGDNVTAMVTLVEQTLDTTLPGSGLCLRTLQCGDRLNEMEFHFATDYVDPARLRKMLADFPDWADAAENLKFSGFHGLMHGYIDLVFRHKGRYYLADYKSNRLDNYGEAAVAMAMRAHHYPLQGLVYALALHRYLRQRLANYDYAEHFGGITYLFTRGMRPGAGDGIWYQRPKKSLIEALDRLFAARGAA